MICRRVIIAALLFFGCNCGDDPPTYIRTTILATCGGLTCAIPNQANELRVQIIDPSEVTNSTQAVLQEDTYRLEEHSFPVTVLIIASKSTPLVLRQHVAMLLNSTVLAESKVEHQWQTGVVNDIAVVLRKP